MSKVKLNIIKHIRLTSTGTIGNIFNTLNIMSYIYIYIHRIQILIECYSTVGNLSNCSLIFHNLIE